MGRPALNFIISPQIACASEEDAKQLEVLLTDCNLLDLLGLPTDNGFEYFSPHNNVPLKARTLCLAEKHLLMDGGCNVDWTGDEKQLERRKPVPKEKKKAVTIIAKESK
jgi:hypothetical protein